MRVNATETNVTPWICRRTVRRDIAIGSYYQHSIEVKTAAEIDRLEIRNRSASCTRPACKHSIAMSCPLRKSRLLSSISIMTGTIVLISGR
jgi:hypothetical protein